MNCDICKTTLDGAPRVALDIHCKHDPRNVELCWECGKDMALKLGVSKSRLLEALADDCPMPAGEVRQVRLEEDSHKIIQDPQGSPSDDFGDSLPF